jgi:hypothetical protein
MAGMKSKATLVLLLLLLISLLTYTFSAGQWTGADPNEAQGEPFAFSEVEYFFEVRDERQLVGEADNVFVGRVVKKVGDSGSPREQLPDSGAVTGTPRTQFAVEVEENVKGSLDGVVTVSQEGGYVSFTADEGPQKGQRVRALALLEHDPLLKPGQRYLFVTNYNQQEGYYQITTPGYGDVPVGEGADEKRRGPLVEKFEKAAKEQIDPRKSPEPIEEVPDEYRKGEDVPESHHEGDEATSGGRL